MTQSKPSYPSTRSGKFYRTTSSLQTSSKSLPPPTPSITCTSAHPHVEPERSLPFDYNQWFRDLRRKRVQENQGRSNTPFQITTPKKPVISKEKISCDIDIESFPVTRGAYSGKAFKGQATENCTLDEAKAYGLEIISWDGITPTPLTDRADRIFAVLAGRPEGDAAQNVYSLLTREGRNAAFSRDSTEHARGCYPALNVGVTHGVGTPHPLNLQTGPHADMVNRLLSDEDVQLLAAFASTAFSMWGPRIYQYYQKRLEKLFAHHPELRRLFPESIFPAATFNFGPKVCTKRHCDCKNCPFGWCAVQALGCFDPKAGGHLIMWELGIAIEFPPGSTILFPSATISHSNVQIGASETRASFTQYCSGALFRWVDYGFRTEKDLEVKAPALHKKFLRLASKNWKKGVALFSTVKQLKGHNIH